MYLHCRNCIERNRDSACGDGEWAFPVVSVFAAILGIKLLSPQVSLFATAACTTFQGRSTVC